LLAYLTKQQLEYQRRELVFIACILSEILQARQAFYCNLSESNAARLQIIFNKVHRPSLTDTNHDAEILNEQANHRLLGPTGRNLNLCLHRVLQSKSAASITICNPAMGKN
jgi:hypothetical protein